MQDAQADSLAGVKLISTPPRRLEGASFDAALAEARDAVAPLGVNPDVFSELRSALIESLEGMSGKSPSALPGGPENTITDLTLTPDGGSGGVLSWTYVNVGDYDLNGEVNISDLSPLGMHFGKTNGAPDWATAIVADGDRNGEVNISDVTPIGQHFFASVQGYNIYGRNQGIPYTLVGSVAISEGSGTPYRFNVNLASVDYDTYAVAPYDATGEDLPQQTLPNPHTEVLDPAVVEVTDVTADGVMLNGDASGIEPGSVIVSAEGEGFLRRVETVTPVAGGVELTTTQATLEDLFDYVRMDHEAGLPFEAMEEFIPAMEGVTLERIDPPAGTAGVHQGSAGLSTGWIHLTLSTKLHENLQVSGKISFNSGIDLELDIGTGWSDFGTLNRFKAACWVDGKVEGTIKAFREFKLNESRQQIGTLRFTPVVIPVGFIPVVIVPEFEIWLKFTATGEVAIETTSKGWAELELGMEYTADSGWNPITDVDYGFDEDQINSVTGKIKGEFGLFSPELDLAIYGVLGPYINFDVPYIDLVAAVGMANPPYVEISSRFGIKASVGAEIEVLGKTISRWDSGEIVNLNKLIFSLRDELTDVVIVEGDVFSNFDDLRIEIDPDTGEKSYFGGKVTLDGVRIDFFKEDVLAATTWVDEIGYGTFAKFLPVGTYDIEFTRSGFFPYLLESFEVTPEMSFGQEDDILVYMDPEWNAETIMVDFTSHVSGAEVTEPIILLEGQVNIGETEPDKSKMYFEPPGGGNFSGYFYQNDSSLTNENGQLNITIMPDGTFSHPVYLKPGVTEVRLWAWRTLVDGEIEHSDAILTSTQHEPLLLNSTREPAAAMVELSWWEDAVSPPSHVSQVPGVPNEDFRLVINEPGISLISGQGPHSGLGIIRQVPGTWHWYYYLPLSQAQAGDTLGIRTLFHDSVWRTGTESDGDLFGRGSIDVYTEVYEEFGFSSGPIFRYPKAILPIDPNGIGFEWDEWGVTIPSTP